MSRLSIDSAEWKLFVRDGARSMGIRVTEAMSDQLAGHARMLLEWNRKMNLTAITDPMEVAVKHVLDSLAPLPFIPENARVLDLGTGGGFPGIPLKIIKPSLDMTLVDASAKKVSFLKHVIRTLNLKTCEAFAARIEELPEQRVFDLGFSFVVSRSLAPLTRLIPWSLPLLAPEGRMIALKGKNVTQELEDLKILQEAFNERSAYSSQTIFYDLPSGDFQRSMVVLEKTP